MIKHISGDLLALIAISSNQILLELIAFVMYLLRWDLVLNHYVEFSKPFLATYYVLIVTQIFVRYV